MWATGRRVSKLSPTFAHILSVSLIGYWFGLCWVFAAVQASLYCLEQGQALTVARGLLTVLASPGAGHGLRGAQTSEVGACGLSRCGPLALGHMPNSTGWAALRHVGSSWTGDWTHVSCIIRFFVTEPPGKPHKSYFLQWYTLSGLLISLQLIILWSVIFPNDRN